MAERHEEVLLEMKREHEERISIVSDMRFQVVLDLSDHDDRDNFLAYSGVMDLRDLYARIGRAPEGSNDLDDEVYAEALRRDHVIEPDGFRARKIREWLAANGMGQEDIDLRMSVSARPSKGLELD